MRRNQHSLSPITPNKGVNIRKARCDDVLEIHKLINYYAKKKLMLPRALNEIYEHLRDFIVVEYNKKIVGCCALYITWNGFAELKCLAINKKYQGKGYGRSLIEKIHQEAKELGVKKIFTLTFIPNFFKKFGYKYLKKEKLPHKIWAECINCIFFPNCKEKAMILELR